MAQDRVRGGKRARLDAAIVAARLAAYGQPFVWGEDDCCLWIANILRVALGYDPAKAWRGRYTTPRGALRMMKGRSLAEVIGRLAVENDWLPIAPAAALIGDVGIAILPGMRAAAIIRFRSVWLGRTERGFAVLQTKDASDAWRV